MELSGCVFHNSLQ